MRFFYYIMVNILVLLLIVGLLAAISWLGAKLVEPSKERPYYHDVEEYEEYFEPIDEP